MKVRLRALKRLGRYAPGDEFEEIETDANILTLLKVAERVEMETEAQPRPPRRKRIYRRRDMVAEG